MNLCFDCVLVLFVVVKDEMRIDAARIVIIVARGIVAVGRALRSVLQNLPLSVVGYLIPMFLVFLVK